MKKRQIVAAAFAVFTVASAIGTTAVGATPADKVTICHGTASDTNPYVVITVSANSFKNGHFDGYPNPSHGANNNPDSIFDPEVPCGGINT